jgi:hypothetical protein
LNLRDENLCLFLLLAPTTPTQLGTKCTAHRMHGCVLHDSHAEVLARRGLLRVLWMELISSKTPQQDPRHNYRHRLLEASSKKKGKYQLRSDIQLHLYISCSPCGDAAIYSVTNNQVMLHTGAKVIVSQESGIDATVCGGEDRLLKGTTVAREEVQIFGKLRTKSGRSNLPPHLRSTSMSCSDKIVKWCVIGLQGGLLSAMIDPPIFLSSIVASRDARIRGKSMAQQDALQRAIPNRVQGAWDQISTADVAPPWQKLVPSVHIVADSFPSDKSAMESKMQAQEAPAEKNENNSLSSIEVSIPGRSTASTRKRKRSETPIKKLSPCGISLNWQCLDPNGTELIVGARGLCQGKKPKSNQDYSKLASRLSRREFVRLAQMHYDILPSGNKCGSERDVPSIGVPETYQEVKRVVSSQDWDKWKASILRSGILAGWLRNSEDGDFLLRETKNKSDVNGCYPIL